MASYNLTVLPPDEKPPPLPDVKISPSDFELRLPDTQLNLLAEIPDASKVALDFKWSLAVASLTNLKLFDEVEKNKVQLALNLANEPDELTFKLFYSDKNNQSNSVEAHVHVKDHIQILKNNRNSSFSKYIFIFRRLNMNHLKISLNLKIGRGR